MTPWAFALLSSSVVLTGFFAAFSGLEPDFLALFDLVDFAFVDLVDFRDLPEDLLDLEDFEPEPEDLEPELVDFEPEPPEVEP